MSKLLQKWLCWLCIVTYTMSQLPLFKLVSQTFIPISLVSEAVVHIILWNTVKPMKAYVLLLPVEPCVVLVFQIFIPISLVFTAVVLAIIYNAVKPMKAYILILSVEPYVIFVSQIFIPISLVSTAVVFTIVCNTVKLMKAYVLILPVEYRVILVFQSVSIVSKAVGIYVPFTPLGSIGPQQLFPMSSIISAIFNFVPLQM